jgi:glycosyltransferase involved in cell wall biosynthesis
MPEHTLTDMSKQASVEPAPGSVPVPPARSHASRTAARAPGHADARINVLMLIAGLGLGGAETVVRLLAEAIDRDRFNVILGCVKGLGSAGEALAAAGADIVCLSDPSKKGTDYLRSLTLRREVRSRRIDIVHTHTTDALVDSGLCKLGMPRLRTIHTFHFGNYPHLPSRHLWLERVFSKLSTRLIAVGEHQRRQIQAVYGFADRRIGMVRNGVPEESATRDDSFRARIGAGDRVVIGTVATLIAQKGLQDLILVAERLKQQRAPALFVIVGEGRLRAELEAMRRDRGVEDMVVLAGWVPSAADVAVPAFDVFFQPSLWEAMSVAVLEAMAAGKPVVATRVGENPRVIEDGVDGVLVDARDIDGMAAALSNVIERPDLRRRLGDAGAAKVAKQFTIAHMSRAYERIYLDMLGRAVA